MYQKSNLIKFDPFGSILDKSIQSDQKINKDENLMIYRGSPVSTVSISAIPDIVGFFDKD